MGRFPAVRNVVPVDHLLYEDDSRRFQHADLLGMDKYVLQRELARLAQRLLWDASPHPWLHERQEAIRHALGCRKCEVGEPYYDNELHGKRI